MKLILDTCTFLWLASAEHRLSATAVELIRDPDRWSMLPGGPRRGVAPMARRAATRQPDRHNWHNWGQTTFKVISEKDDTPKRTAHYAPRTNSGNTLARLAGTVFARNHLTANRWGR